MKSIKIFAVFIIVLSAMSCTIETAQAQTKHQKKHAKRHHVKSGACSPQGGG